MNTTVITPEESDVFLAAYEDWLALDPTVQEAHIAKGSVYAQTQWTCADVVWEDDPDTEEVEEVDIPALVKEAVAYYAYIDFHGNLYGDPAAVADKHGNLRATMDKVGDLQTEVEYFQGGSFSGSGTQSHTGYADALMGEYCVSSGTGTGDLVRV